MIVLVTGTSGSKVSEFTEGCVSKGIAEGKQWTHIHVANLMYARDPERSRLSYDQWEDGILKRGASLSLLRAATFDDLMQKVAAARSSNDEAVLFISTHATFWYRKTLIPGLDLTRLNELKPDMFVTVVDDVIEVWNRLRSSGQSRWSNLSPVDVLEWREIETFFTEQMAFVSGERNNPKPFFVIAQRYSPDLLFRLVAEPATRRYYRSYPITFVAGRPEVQQQADKLAEGLEEDAILFNPMGILDWDRLSELRSEYETWCDSKGYTPPGADWEEIQNHLQSQTISRDHRLIDQSHGLVVFYPQLDYYSKREKDFELTPLVPFSSGVLDEMQYGTQLGKEILLVWTSSKHPGPFLENIFTHKFPDPESLLHFMKNQGE
jgi:hypothetical protein